MPVEWRTVQCHMCGGHGLVSAYTLSGDDFLGAKECDHCYGNGCLYISPSGRLVVYPGGPFRGMSSPEEWCEAGKDGV